MSDKKERYALWRVEKQCDQLRAAIEEHQIKREINGSITPPDEELYRKAHAIWPLIKEPK